MTNRLLVLIVASSMLLGAATLRRGHEWGDDFASYIMQAESIANSSMDEFIEHNSFTIRESSIQIGPIAYPWGYPLLLVPAYIVKGVHPLALKIPGLLFYTGFLFCLFMLVKTRLDKVESLLLVSLFAFNPLLLSFVDQILSDIPFLFFITLGLLCITRSKNDTASNLITGMVLFLAYFIRTTGILLLASFLLYQGLRWVRDAERRRAIVMHAIQVLAGFGVLWIITSFVFPDEQGSYFTQLSGLTATVFLQNLSYYFFLFQDFFGSGILSKFLDLALLVFFLLGIRSRAKADPVFLIFFTLYWVALLFWPSRQGPRFIFPLFPIFLYFTVQGMKFAVERLPQTYWSLGQRAFYGFWIVVLASFLFRASANAYANIQNDRAINGPFDSSSREVYRYIMEHTPPDSVIVFFKPRAMRLMTDHDSLMSTKCERILKGDYLVLSKKVGENQQIPPEKIDACNLPLQDVFANNRFIIYRIQK